MKKLFLSLSLLAAAATAAQAQDGPGISYGVKAGGSLTSVTGKGISDAKNVFGFNGGVFANFAVNDLFSVQPEVLYSMKGYKVEGSAFGITGKTTQRLHYIDVPVLAHFNADGLFFELGPQIGFLASAKAHGEISGLGSGDQDNKDSFKSVDFGYAAGLGYQMPSGPGIGLRYNGGFTDIAKNNVNNNAVRNSAFQLYLTYMFGSK